MRLPEGVRRLFRLGEPSRDVEDELSFHFTQTVEELEAGGLPAAEARREAERRFGDVVAYRRELVGMDEQRARRRERRLRLEAYGDVVMHALRSVTRAPLLSAAVVLTLALGLGANVTMYAIVDRLLLSPPPHTAESEQLRRLGVEEFDSYRGERRVSGTLSYPDLLDARAATLLQGVAVWSETRLTQGHGADARELHGIRVSGNYFELVGARPVLGRALQEADARPEAERVAVISHELWQREFGGAANVPGSTLRLDDEVWTIVGVAPKRMTTLRLAAVDVWLPLRPSAQPLFESRGYLAFAGVARLHDGVDEAAAVAQLTNLLRRGRAEQIAAGEYDAEARMVLTPLLEARGPQALPEAAVARWLAGVSLIVLLIACVNVANLLLARVVRQRREIAVRLALGISRARLMSQVLLEGALLGLTGGAAAVLLAHWSGAALSSALLPSIAWSELGWSTHLLPAALLLAVCAGVLSSLVPALQASRPAVGETLRLSDAGGRPAARTRTVLALVQAALSVVLLVGAGLFVRSLEGVRALDLGMRVHDVLYVETRLASRDIERPERARIGHAVLERLRTHPAVEAAAGANTAPYLFSVSNNVRLPGTDSVPVIGDGTHWMFIVSDGYFDLLGMDIVRGRALDAQDAAGGAKHAVVNETMARALWPDRDPIGACMIVGRDGADCTTVVGVARDSRQRYIREQGNAHYFLPLTPEAAPGVVMVRPRPGVRDAAAQLRVATASVDPRIRLVEVTPALERMKPQERSWRLGATLFSAFGALALAVAALGLYAVLAFDVSQRTRELGVRAALGASRAGLMILVLRRALAVAAAGLALGCAVAAVLAPRLQHLLYEVGPHDPATYIAAAAALLAVAATAALLPARRAAAVPPGAALRTD